MADSLPPLDVPPLHEHDFPSSVPLVGALIRSVRRGLYSLTAKWSTRALIQQQTDINAALAQHINVLVAQVNALNAHMAQQTARTQRLLAEQDARLIEQDREAALLTRTVAELQAQVRQAAKQPQPLVDDGSSETASIDSGRNVG